jgi:hypothetical protein
LNARRKVATGPDSAQEAEGNLNMPGAREGRHHCGEQQIDVRDDHDPGQFPVARIRIADADWGDLRARQAGWVRSRRG